MSQVNNTHRGPIPPCPDPALYILVRTREGVHWRRKRGTVKTARVNTVLAANNAAHKILMPAASRIVKLLEPFTRQLDKGRITIRLASALLKPYLEKPKINYSALNEMAFQPAYPFDRLFLTSYEVRTGGKQLRLHIDIYKGCVKAQNKLVTDYYFELILLYGKAWKEKSLHIRYAESGLYSYGKEKPGVCTLSLAAAPAHEPWLLLLKLNSLEGKEMAAHPKHYGMKVILTSAGNKVGLIMRD